MRRRPFDSASFVLGAVIVIVGVVFLLAPDNRTMPLGWLPPVLFFGLGTALVTSSVQRYSRRANGETDERSVQDA